MQVFVDIDACIYIYISYIYIIYISYIYIYINACIHTTIYALQINIHYIYIHTVFYIVSTHYIYAKEEEELQYII